MRLLPTIIDLLLPKRCVGCSREETWLCDECLGFIQIPRSASCPFCEEATPAGRSCPRHALSALDGLLAAGYYHDPILRKALHQYKYGYAEELGERLGGILARIALSHRTLLPPTALVMPIPLSGRRLRERGFNQTLPLAHAVARALGFPILADLLQRVSQREPQALADLAARRTNMHDAFVTQRPLPSHTREVILIDDVSKTGATLEVAARVLKNAGATGVYALVLARG